MNMIRARPDPLPPDGSSPFQSHCGGGIVSSTPCGVAVVVVMLSSTPCGVAVVVVMVSSIPCGVAVVLVIVIGLQGHNKAPKKSNENDRGSKGLTR